MIITLIRCKRFPSWTMIDPSQADEYRAGGWEVVELVPRQPTPTIVLDLTGGALQAAYSEQPIDIIVISYDSDDIADADDEDLGKNADGETVRIAGPGGSEIEPEVVAHYKKEIR